MSGLNLTLTEVREEISRNERVFNLGFVPAEGEQKALEAELISRGGCSVQDKEYYQEHLGDLDERELSRLLGEKFYDPAVMQFFSCLLQSLSYQSPRASSEGILPRERVRHWLVQLKELSSGANGTAITAALEGMANKEIVMKAPFGGSLIHEIFIGLFGTNFLRAQVPNFSFVYGGFACSPPFISEKNVLSWCSNNCTPDQIRQGTCSEVSYALYENVTPAIDLRKRIENCTGEQYLNWFLQVTLALYTASKEINFTHFDLHNENVLIRQLGRRVNVPYQFQGRTIFVETDTIPMLIDYGFSFCTYRGRDHPAKFGGLRKFLGNFTGSFPMYDIYKLLLWGYVTANDTKNQQVFDVSRQLFRYFSPENPKGFVDFGLKNFFSLPQRANVPLDDFVEFVLSLNPTAVVPIPWGETFSCSGDSCQTPEEIDQQLGMNRDPQARDLFELYDLLTTYQTQGRNDDARAVLAKVNPEMIAAGAREFETLASILASSIPETQSLVGLPTSVLFRPQTVNEYRQYVNRIVQSTTWVRDFNLYETILLYMAKFFPQQISENEISRIVDLTRFLTPYFERVEQQKQSLKQDLSYVRSIRRGNVPRAAQWYFEGLPQAIKSIS